MDNRAHQKLVSVLRRAHAGELAAALAYQGHSRSLADPTEAAEVITIALEEVEHRESVSRMLSDLGERPRRMREGFFRAIGSLLGSLCRVSGWLAPMYGAGFLESGNVREYEEAAALAVDAGRPDLAPDLLRMADVECRHELYFRSKVMESRVGRLLPLWAAPPPRGYRSKVVASLSRRAGFEAGRRPHPAPTGPFPQAVSRGAAR